VQSGEHKLIYTYEPESFRIGGAISILSMAGIFVALGLSRKKDF